MMIDKFFLYSSVKSFIVSIHLGCSGIGMIVCFVKITYMFVKVFLELTSVVSKNQMDLEWKEFLKRFKEFFCCQRSSSAHHKRKGTPRIQINTSNTVVACTKYHFNDRIKSYHMSWILSFEVFWFTEYFVLLFDTNPTIMVDFLWILTKTTKIFDDSPYC